MLRKDEIPRNEWPAFFSSFGAAHRGKLCAMVFESSTPGPQVRFEPLIFAALAPENATEDARIRVLLDDWLGHEFAHIIAAPRHVFLRHVVTGVVETLEIDGASGKTTMRFEAAS